MSQVFDTKNLRECRCSPATGLTRELGARDPAVIGNDFKPQQTPNTEHLPSTHLYLTISPNRKHFFVFGI